jgi:hypothetical protein
MDPWMPWLVFPVWAVCLYLIAMENWRLSVACFRSTDARVCGTVFGVHVLCVAHCVIAFLGGMAVHFWAGGGL